MSFQPGELVVCVDDSKPPEGKGYGDEIRPQRGRIYTIRDCEEAGVRLHEIHNVPRNYREGFEEISYRASRFRPVDDTKLEVFRRIAASPRERIEVGA